MSIKKYQNLINRHINDIYLPSIKNDKLREIIEYSLKGGKRFNVSIEIANKTGVGLSRLKQITDKDKKRVIKYKKAKYFLENN